MMCFTAFPEIQLNPGMRDIQWAKSTLRAAITHKQRAYISVWVIRNTHPPRMSLDRSLVPGFNRVSRKAVKRI